MSESTQRFISDRDHRDLLIALNGCLDLNRETICRLSKDPPTWLDEDPPPAARLSGPVLAAARSTAAASRALAQREQQRAASVGAEIITLCDPDYPMRLRDLDRAPPVLYIKGALPRSPAVAIVGSRKADPYGLEAAEMFGRALSETGLTVVSGLARGIDSAAHRGALTAPGGRTVAVQGRGIDEAYPRSNRHLADRIPQQGAVISEFSIGTPPLPHHFPIRNRIIAALAVAVLVVQAAPRSGSLITARLGLELGRYVFAVPGPIFHERAVGTNSLLADGALLVQHPRDLLEALPLAVQDQLRSPEETGSESLQGIAGEVAKALLSHESLSPEELARLLSRPIEQVLTSLLELEITGHVRRYPGPVFHLRH